MTPPGDAWPLTLVAAVSRNGVIGRGGRLPWDLPEDRAHFRRTTMGHAVIMGRRTWDETGGPLAGRRNIVVSRAGVVTGAGEDVAVVPTFEQAVALARTTDPDPMVIGGEQIFRLALPFATRMILTELDFDADGDTRFPPFDRGDWSVVERRPGDRATYAIYQRTPVPRIAGPGSPGPLGATVREGGVNFAVFSEHGQRALVCLCGPTEPMRETARYELRERTGPVFHGLVPGVAAGTLYGLRVEGPFDPGRGHLFDANNLLIDPYARALERQRGVVLADDFDWGADRPPRIPWRDTLIYELHVRGFTRRHPDVPEPLRGTYAGLAHPAAIDHLTSLGVTAVELLPVQQHLDEEVLVGRGLVNYWGYNTIGFFAVEPRYAHAPDPAGRVREFKAMVKALHAAGLEVILDVVYNHTAEGGAGGPTLSWRGLDNAVYYHLDPSDPRRLLDFSGTGNSLNLGALYPNRMVMDSLHYWAQEMRVDGFRFDLAPELTRAAPDYRFRVSAGFLQAVQQDPILGRLKLIAEPWDFGADGYQLGHFPDLWSEWNDRFRDGCRRFWWGGSGARPDLERCLVGSPEVFRGSGRHPHASINFITCHDGFTLEDLVSYERKHNEANGEDNRDGANVNHSGNHGVEGPSGDENVLRARERHKRNLLATLFLSRGVPMLLGGDELGRSQRGNNNAYNQDNEISWVDWTLDEPRQRLLAFVRALSALRRRAITLLGDYWPEEEPALELRWLELEQTAADESGPGHEGFALLITARPDAGLPESEPRALLLAVNGAARPGVLALPVRAGGEQWQVALDTAGEQDGLAGDRIRVAAQSVVVLEARASVPARA
jgi:isoamylase